MSFLVFICVVIGYSGVIRMQRRLYKRGVLTEGSFVLFQVPVLSLSVLAGFLAFSTTPTGIWIGIILSLLCTFLGIPVARWVYRKYIASK